MGSLVVAEKLAAARKLGHALAADADSGIDSVYTGGSLTAGLGNATSDADVFVLVAPGSAIGEQTTQYSVDGHRVDVERYPLTEIEALVAELAEFELRRDNLPTLHKLPDTLDLVLRLVSAETLVGSERLTALRERITESLPAIRRTAVNHAAISINGYLEDFLGAAAEGDLDTAAFTGQSLVAYAGKAVAAAAGDLYFSNKWIYKQLARTPIEGFPVDLFTYYQRGAWTADGTTAAEGLALFVQTCAAVAQLLCNADAPLAAWPGWRPGPAEEGRWRSTGFCVLRTGDGILLHWELGRQLLLKEAPAFVWALCDGRSVDGIVEAVRQLSDSVPALKGLSRVRIESILTALQTKGLVGTEPFSLLSTV
ncbi:PqqD family peptide modification chaperone [Catenulispora pinisilvae]|uniref:PqqD family peptide modification chaperone n=1 Tax=Catenulispora pinisilvae TaxID=2705253 RepID=UPI001891CF5F|nr:PqqD family peptide modification chaperone [Catenulispora pinisilvae]